MDEKDEHFITESFNNYGKTISLSVKITQWNHSFVPAAVKNLINLLTWKMGY